jgi:hypothetical protein
MDKKLTFTGGEPNINFDDILRDPIANRAALFGIMKAFNIGTNENFIISGCVPTVSTGVNVAVTAGYIFLNGEILEVEAQTVANSGTLDLYKYTKTTTYDSGGDKTFNDAIARQTWQKNRGTVVAATAPILTTELDVVDGDKLDDKIVQLTKASTAEAKALSIDTKLITPSTLGDVTGGLLIKKVDIGDWNMDANTSVTVAHGLTLSKIVSVDVKIRNDSTQTKLFDFINPDVTTSTWTNEGVYDVGTTVVTLVRKASGFFDSTVFDETSYNRGYITILYLP